jgi:hypothetical protein
MLERKMDGSIMESHVHKYHLYRTLPSTIRMIHEQLQNSSDEHSLHLVSSLIKEDGCEMGTGIWESIISFTRKSFS